MGTFAADDIRGLDPTFQGERFQAYVACTRRLVEVAARCKKTVGRLAIRWCLEQSGVTVALCGARRPAQVIENAGAAEWALTPGEQDEMERLVREMLPKSIGADFMAPP